MTGKKNSFIGAWDLVPELCQYQDGVPPRSGAYDISLKDGAVHFDMSWTDHDDHSHSLAFGGPSDGTVQTLNGAPAHELSISKVDEFTIDSSAYADGRETQYARRQVSKDGALMTVVQVHRHPEGPSTRNFQVYRRRSA